MNQSDYAQTTLQGAQATALTAITEQVAVLNTNLKAAYAASFSGWLISWLAGRVTDKTTAPAPPNGFVVGYFNDPTTGPGSLGPYGDAVVQWPYPAVGKDPVSGQPTIPTIPASPNPPVDPNAPPPGVVGTKCDAIDPALDGWQVGVAGQGTRADGSVWEKFAFHTPFGSGWYGMCVVAAKA